MHTQALNEKHRPKSGLCFSINPSRCSVQPSFEKHFGELPENGDDPLEVDPVNFVECGEMLAVNIQYCNDAIVLPKGDNNLAPGLAGARYVAGELLDIGDNNGLTRLPGAAAHSPADGFWKIFEIIHRDGHEWYHKKNNMTPYE